MSRWARFFSRRKRMMEALDQDIRDYLERETQDNIERGMPPEEARYAALRKFGNVTRVKEETWEVWSFVWLEQLWRDIRFGVRQLRRSPGFTAIAIISLALGIGANAALFSIIEGVFLRPLPYPLPQRLVYPLSVWEEGTEDAVGSADYLFWKEHTQVFESAGAYERLSGSNLVVGQQARYVQVTGVAPGLFDTLGVKPRLGREFTNEEGQLHGSHAVILSHALWSSLFPTGAQALGETVQMDGESYLIVGVMPREFQFVAAADIYTPLQLTFEAGNHDANYGMVARLRPGVTLDQAQADVDRVFCLFKETYPEGTWKHWRGLRLIPYQQELTGNVRTPFLVLFGAVLLVLLIAVANMTSLCLGRTASRHGEIALRTAMGASRAKVLRQLITEGILLTSLGAALGLLLAAWGLHWLLLFIPQTISIDLSTSLVPLGDQVKLDLGVLAFTLLVSLLAGIAAGILPYAQMHGGKISEELKQGGRSTASRLRQPRVRNTLVTAEVALSVVLLTGAGLLTKSFLRLRTVNPGFNPQSLWAVETEIPPGQYTTTARAWALQQQVSQNLERVPGVVGVATTSNLPVERGLNYPVKVPGCGSLIVQARAISSNYFRVMHIPLLTGREFRDTDQNNVVIVNNVLAVRCWRGRQALGAAVGKGQVVGVVGDTRESGLDHVLLPVVYCPQWTVSDEFTKMVHGWFLAAWVIRSEAPLRFETVEQALVAVDPTLPIAHFRPMTRLISGSFALSKSRMMAGLLDGFTGLALLFALIGIYGVLSYQVAQRTHEIGIRMALGARKQDVLRMVLREGVRLALVGLAIGLAGALALTRWLSSLLYEVKPADPFTFLAVCLCLLCVALAACYVPARNALHVDPVVALRHE
jgi:putative ABC transport system permease protein